MRTATVKIHDKEYLVCFSTRVLLAIEEREGYSEKGLQRILKDGKASDLFWLLAQMVDAGNRYAKIEGIDNPGTISYDEILDTVGVDEYQNMFTAIVEAVKAGNTPTIKTTPAKRKNAKTTQQDE